MAKARSTSRYFCVRFSSLHTARMASLVKMPWKMLLSMRVEGMGSASWVNVSDGSFGAH